MIEAPASAPTRMWVHVRVALVAWIVTLTVAFPAALGVFFFVLAMANSGGRIGPAAYLAGVVAAAAVGAFATALLSNWAGRTSQGAIMAAPAVVGCGAGLMLGAFSASRSPESLGTAIIFLIAPVAGAFAGTLLSWRGGPLQAGALTGGAAVIVALLS